MKLKFRFRLIERYVEYKLKLSPQQNLVYGFALYTTLGWLLLCLPFSHKQSISFLDNLFTATSAISTTGLVTVSVFDSYNFFGQLIIIILIQIGGIGYMTLGSFIILARHKPFTHVHKRVLMAEFSMPKGFELKDFLKSVIIFTVIAESIGALCLYIAFVMAGVDSYFAVWSSIFHSISSFCTAGFGLYNNSFEGFADNTFLNIIISVLSLLGSLGFIVITDIWYRITGKSKQITFTTKVISSVLVIMLACGTIMFYFNEPSTTIATKDYRLLTSFFQSMTALTTVGFNTIPIGNLTLPLLLITVFLMYIGASPSGTGGGMKSTTLTAIIAIIWSRLRGNQQVVFLGKTIPMERLYIATSTFIFYTAIIFGVTFLLSFSENASLINILFETASALGTVGLSMGLTGELTDFGKSVLIVTMFVGRLGVLTFGISIFAKRTAMKKQNYFTDLAV